MVHGRVKIQLLTALVLFIVIVLSASRFHGEVELGVDGVSLIQGPQGHLSLDGNQEAGMKTQRNYLPTFLIGWDPPGQPGSAPAFCSSPGNVPLRLASGSNLSSWRAHKKQKPYCAPDLIPAVCKGLVRDTRQLQVVKQGLGFGSAGARLPLLALLYGFCLSQYTGSDFQSGCFPTESLTNLPWAIKCFPFCMWI